MSQVFGEHAGWSEQCPTPVHPATLIAAAWCTQRAAARSQHRPGTLVPAVGVVTQRDLDGANAYWARMNRWGAD